MTEENHFPDEGMVDFDTELDDHSGDGEPVPLVEPDPKVAELTADLQRLQAEYVNYKRRVDRDRELVLQNAKYSILSALLPVMDDVDRAREHGELEGGLKAIAESLEKIVEGQGLHKFGAVGDEFDPTRHEALMHGHSPDVTTSTCQNIVQAGYTIGDRVVRPALVTVVDPEPEQGDTSPEARSAAGDEAPVAKKLEHEDDNAE
ncbi:MAG TPA: nucleotide exchange factor GrpE [Nocardioidaceae bacterium]|nr:nucleotide exchange factor GrpE [Nocardioidaceae bacterium]